MGLEATAFTEPNWLFVGVWVGVSTTLKVDINASSSLGLLGPALILLGPARTLVYP